MQIKLFIPSTITVVYIALLLSLECMDNAIAQEPVFELPVQLVGFPVIILAVRLSNFVKKLQYSLNPQTYKSRARRSISTEDEPHTYSKEAIDLTVAEKEILSELGPKACVLEEPCRIHAARPGRPGEQPNWNDILRHYKVQSAGMKQWYLLSVFLGDVIRDVSLCKKLAKRLNCDRDVKPFIRD